MAIATAPTAPVWDSRNVRGLPQEKDQIQRAADDYKRAAGAVSEHRAVGQCRSSKSCACRRSLESVNFRLQQIDNRDGNGARCRLDMAVILAADSVLMARHAQHTGRTSAATAAAARAALGRGAVHELAATAGGRRSLVAAGLYLVYQAKSQRARRGRAGLAAKQLLNLNDLSAREDLLPALTPIFPDSAPSATGGSRAKSTTSPAASPTSAPSPRIALAHRRAVPPVEAAASWCAARRSSARLLAVVGLFFAAFLLAHVCSGACADSAATRRCCPAVLLLSGVGLILMVSLRDPVRDNLLFVDFAQGVVVGCVLLAGCSELDYERLFGKLELRAAAGQLRALRAADSVRLRPRHQRRQGQPVRLSAGGDHPHSAGLLPGGLFRQPLGRAAARARDAARRWPR